ncbi:MAG: type VI secretion system tube protein Hcp [Steroidobacteraceae bacterium]
MRTTLLLAGLLLTGTAFADHNQHSGYDSHASGSLITVALNGLACSTSAGGSTFDVRSWSWGASSSVTISGSGAGVGKATANALSIRKALDACSSVLLGAVTTGRHFASLALTDTDDDGNVVALLTLSDVFVTSWTVGSSLRDASPDESVSFVFRKVCLSTDGATQLCYDAATNSTT